MGSILEIIIIILDGMYSPFDLLIFPILFFYCQSFLRTLSVSVILILTLGKILTIMKTNFWKAIKYMIYVWYFGYCLYSFGIFTNLFSLDLLDWSTFMFSVLAPISMLIVGKQVQNARIKGHQIFIYYVLMLLYLMVAIIWYIYYPEQVIFTVLFIYWVIALFIVSIVNYLC